MLKLLLSLCALWLVIASPVQADEGKIYHALAMHGAPALAEDFQHFSYADPGAPKGGRLRQSVIGTFDTLNPHIVKGKSAQGLNLVFGRLMMRSWDEPFTMYPYIAQYVVMPDDRSWIEFHLDPRARFEDGTPITAEDVRFSFEQLRTHGKPNFRRIYGMVDMVSVRDEHIIRFDFDAEAYDGETALIIAMMPVYGRHVWKDRDFSQTTLTPFISSGPYKFATIEAGRRIVYERVKDFWAQDIPSQKGQNNFDQMVFDYFRDENIALEAFKAGEIDVRSEQDISSWVSQYQSIAPKGGANVIKDNIKHGRPDWIRGLIFNTRRPHFSDLEVRKALTFAFNFEWINKTLFSGEYQRALSIYPNSELADDQFSLPVNESVSDHRHAMREAVSLLEKAGWKINNNRLQKNGAVFSFEILLENPADEKIALEYVRHLKKLGIDARVRTVDSAQFAARLDQFDYDMVLYRWHSTLSPGNEQMFYWSTASADTNGTRNYPGIRSATVDMLATKLANAKTRDELVETARLLDREIMAGYYFIPLYYSPYDRLAYWSYLGKPEKTPLYGAVLESWWDGRGSSE